jgi:hypothetical protein
VDKGVFWRKVDKGEEREMRRGIREEGERLRRVRNGEWV